jgi:hypothetical protein
MVPAFPNFPRYSRQQKMHEFLDWFEPSRKVIALRSVLTYYAIEIGSYLFLLESFGDFPGMFSSSFLVFSGCPRCGSILSIYSRGTGS